MKLTHWSRNLIPYEKLHLGPIKLDGVAWFLPAWFWPKTVWRHCCKPERNE